MSRKYVSESSHIADYDLWELPGVDFPLRGPRVSMGGAAPLVSFLGAAQVFGAFVNHPFPALLGDMLSVRALNLGNGGAGPGLFTAKPKLLEIVNQSAVCVVQVMSARSSMQNSYMQSINGRASVQLTYPDGKTETCLGHHAFPKIAEHVSDQAFSDLITETLENYVAQYRALVAAITVPKVLLYVGRNPPLADAGPEVWTPKLATGTHPHLITEEVFATLASLFDASVRVIGPEGFDRRLVDRGTGDYAAIKRSETFTITRHSAYISPHMHTRAALELYPVLMNYV